MAAIRSLAKSFSLAHIDWPAVPTPATGCAVPSVPGMAIGEAGDATGPETATGSDRRNSGGDGDDRRQGGEGGLADPLHAPSISGEAANSASA